ncbi:MAG: ISNCY family transposase, partial [Methylococcales bacterium]|nr:ISNCY family transposase [Methylococcales bacterium]
AMRKSFEVQLALGATPIEQVEIPTNSRDEMPPVLTALQWIFTTPELNREVFELLEKTINPTGKSIGRPGMDLWQILVLGVIRLTLDANYDRIHYVANTDSLTRQLLGQPAFDMAKEFKLSTLKENVPLLTADLLEEINEVIARHGHQVIKKKDEGYHIKIDSYVFETNVHFPTDLNLANDCARKCIILTARLASSHGLAGWRKHKNWKSQVKKLARICAKTCRAGGKNKAQRIRETAKTYLEKLYGLEEKTTQSIAELRRYPLTQLELAQLHEIEKYRDLLIKHIFLIYDRLIEGKPIPAGDKLYSIFEQHTEWINKGKSRPNVEVGRRLLIATDQNGLIHDYKIMSGGNEPAEVIPLVERLLGKLGEGNILSLSSDKGFSKKEDRDLLELYIPEVVMPPKGKNSKAEKERQSHPQWRKLRNKHSAIESDINCL